MRPPFSPDDRRLAEISIRRAAGAISSELEGDTVILHTATGEYSGLDRVGTTVWKRLERPAAFGDLVATVCAEYEVEERRCSADLCLFLNDLFAKRLIEIDPYRTA